VFPSEAPVSVVSVPATSRSRRNSSRRWRIVSKSSAARGRSIERLQSLCPALPVGWRLFDAEPSRRVKSCARHCRYPPGAVEWPGLPRMPEMDVAFLTIAELSRLYRQRELSPVEVTKLLLARIAAHDGKLHSFLRLTEEAALA